MTAPLPSRSANTTASFAAFAPAVCGAKDGPTLQRAPPSSRCQRSEHSWMNDVAARNSCWEDDAYRAGTQADLSTLSQYARGW